MKSGGCERVGVLGLGALVDIIPWILQAESSLESQ